MYRWPMAQGADLGHSGDVMSLISALPRALQQLSPAAQTLTLFFIAWVLVMFLVLRIDGNRAR